MIRRSVPALLCLLASPVCSRLFLSVPESWRNLFRWRSFLASVSVYALPCVRMRERAGVRPCVQVQAYAGRRAQIRPCAGICVCMRAGVCRCKRPCACAYACVCAGVCACVRGVAAVSGRFFSGSGPDLVLKPPRQKFFFRPGSLDFACFSAPPENFFEICT